MTAPEKEKVVTFDSTEVHLEERKKASASDLLVKDDKYKVEGMIARGGMATVFEAKDKNCRRKVALKVIQEDQECNPEVLHRFIEEAQIAAQLDHPNILPIYDLNLDKQNNPYYAMKMVKGYTLEEIICQLRTGRKETIQNYPLSRLLQIFIKICEAVNFASSKGVIHRDLKPENIMIGEFGEVLIMDWGIAKIMDDEAHTDGGGKDYESIIDSIKHDDQFEIATTMQGQILGTPSFMAPEQVLSQDNVVDHRADVYALGGILYNMLALDSPHSEMNIKELLRNKINGKIPSPEKRAQEAGNELVHLPNGKIPSGLSAVCQKAMELDPKKRYQSAKEVQDDVEAFQNGFATQAEGASQAKLIKLLLLRHKRLSFELLLLFTMILLYLSFNYYKLQFAQIESETATSFAEEVFERGLKREDKIINNYKVMGLMVPEAKEKIQSYLEGNELLKALSISNQYVKFSHDPYFHSVKAEILIKLSRPRSAKQAVLEGLNKFPNDTKLSELLKSMNQEIE